MMEWSEMLPEVLDILAVKHVTFYEDYMSFAGVCKSWRLAATRTYQNSNEPPSRLPSLMLAVNSDDHESREIFLFSNKSIRKIKLPEAYGKVCRSSCGWLLTYGKDRAPQLINPLSREIINLPKIGPLPGPMFPFCWDEVIRKVVLVMESKLVVVIWGNCNLGFCHIGDNKWRSIETMAFIDDITFFNGYVYCSDNRNAIRAYKINGKDPAVLVDRAIMIPIKDYEIMFSSFIVGLDDGERKQLLLIIRDLGFEEEEEEEEEEGLLKGIYYTKDFHVLSYDLERGKWSKEVKDFGNKTLFVGYTSSFWVEDTTGMIKSNCIYYTMGDSVYDLPGMERDMGIYHLSDGTIEPRFAGESLSRVEPPIWLQST